MEIARTIITVALVLVSVILIAVVLMQKSKSSGLGSAFGGDTSSLAGRGKSASKEAKLQKVTVITAIIIGVLSLVLVVLPK